MSAGRSVLGEADVGPSVCVKFPGDGGRVKISDLFRTLDVPAAFHTNMQIESSQLRDHVMHHLVKLKIFNLCFVFACEVNF